MEKDVCHEVLYWTALNAIIPTLFSHFLRFCYPYFNVFFFCNLYISFIAQYMWDGS